MDEYSTLYPETSSASASGITTCWPFSTITSAPNGITAQAINAKIKVSIGAIMNSMVLALNGIIGSLISSLIASANGCNSPKACITPTTAAEPAMSYFIDSIPREGLSDTPPVSNVIPLPTKAIGFCSLEAPFHFITTNFATSLKFSASSPRVVSAAVPKRSPEVMVGFSVSNGTEFLLQSPIAEADDPIPTITLPSIE
uniref:Uncharacterized protein n=1 Tax=Glossina austeni TaxID=7395 RepID=A0A1A9VK85_GLOAU